MLAKLPRHRRVWLVASDFAANKCVGILRSAKPSSPLDVACWDQRAATNLERMRGRIRMQFAVFLRCSVLDNARA